MIDIKPREFWTDKPLHPNVPRGIIPAHYRYGLVAHHNGPPVPTRMVAGDVAAECRFLRSVEHFHAGKARIAKTIWYSYAVGNSGNLYECQGHRMQWANGKDQVGGDDGPDIRWYTCIWIGGGRQQPSAAAIESFTRLAQHLRDLGAGNRVLPHNRFRIKACPGVELDDVCAQLDRQPIILPETVPLSPAVEEPDMDRFILANEDRYPINQTTGQRAGWIASYGAPALRCVGPVPDVRLVGTIIAVEGSIVVTQEGNHISQYDMSTL